MPDLDGFELMTQLKARFPDLDVILMTGSIDDLDEKLVRALRSPAFYFIQKPFDRDVLCTLVERCLELRWRREDHQRNLNRLEMEIAEARAFQQSLLPEREAILNGLSICCRYLPSVQLGGDLYDYVDAGSGRTALLIADVSGHGVSAAMLTGVVKSAFRASIAEGYDPYAVVRRVWGGLSAFRPDRFVTLFTALVSRRERRLAYVNAGHPSVLLWNVTGKLKWLESGGPLVSPALPASTWDAPPPSPVRSPTPTRPVRWAAVICRSWRPPGCSRGAKPPPARRSTPRSTPNAPRSAPASRWPTSGRVRSVLRLSYEPPSPMSTAGWSASRWPRRTPTARSLATAR